MISRRLIRIKAMQTYYAFLQDDTSDIKDVLSELKHNIEQSYLLYIYLHGLLIAINTYAKERMEIARKKFLPTELERTPNTKFIDNKLIAAIAACPTMQHYATNDGFNWTEHPEFIKSLWADINAQPFFQKYMESPDRSVKADIIVVQNILSKVIVRNKYIDGILEEENIYWNDDLEFLCSNIIQNVKHYDETTLSDFSVPPTYRNDSDEDFGRRLIKNAVLHTAEYDELILASLKKWEIDRIAFLDRVILHLAICEILYMPEMPVKVTLNEYIDIAKCYSTDKSSLFINGVLDNIYMLLRKDGKINKSALGMVDVE